jgi:hypothetical protein
MAEGKSVSGTVFNAPGSSGPVAALVGLQQENQAQMDKLMKVIQQLQEERRREERSEDRAFS